MTTTPQTIEQDRQTGHGMTATITETAPVVRKTTDGGFEVRVETALDLRAIPATRADDTEWDAEGWAVKYGVEDSYGTTFVRGCFDAVEPLASRYPYLWMHRTGDLVGLFEPEEREEGLWIRVRFDDNIPGNDARARARSGSAPGCSVGFIWYPTPEQQAGNEDPSLILSARLMETSQIVLGMQAVPGAELQAVRSAIALPTEEETVEVQRSAEAPATMSAEVARALLRLRTA